jgi:replicative DNA helicase
MVEAVFTRESSFGPGADTPRLTRPTDLLGAWEADAAAAFEARTKGIPRGPVTGLSKLDAELGGALQSGLNVLNASPGVGKTALALQIAAGCGCPAIYLSAEMSALELLRRLTARVTETYLGRLRSGELAPADSVKLARRAAEAVPHLVIADATTAFAPIPWLQHAAAVVRGDARHLLLVVDSVHSWAEGIPGDLDEYTRLGLALQSLRVLARSVGCPILAIAERNRASMTKGGLSASAGHRSFEYGAESMLELNRAEDAVEDASGEVSVRLRIAKNRHGSPNRTIPLLFHGALQRFREADR